MTKDGPIDTTSVHVQQAVGGDPGSFDWVVARFQPLVQAHIRYRLGGGVRRASDVEDLSQDVWFVTMQKLRDLDAPDGHFGAVLMTFLASTSTFLCNNFLRKQLRRGTVTSPMAGDNDSSSPDHQLIALTTGVVTRIARNEVKAHLEAALESLDSRKRNIVVLRLLEQQSLRSIATTLELPRSAVSAHYKLALVQLRRQLPDDAFDAIRSCMVRR